MEALIRIAPRLRSPIQLAGFLFAVLAIALIQKLNPSDRQAMAIALLAGIALVALALLFHPRMIELIPKSQRAVFVISVLSSMFVSFGALAFSTVTSIVRPPLIGARFDTTLTASGVKLIRGQGGPDKFELTWSFVPLAKDDAEGATIFTGVVTLHDESEVAGSGPGSITQKSCDEVPTCIGSHFFRSLAANPLLVRANTSGTPHTIVVEVKRIPKIVRVWWEFYQREGVNGAECRFDNSGAAPPATGIPPLAMVASASQIAIAQCYRSFGQKAFETNL